MKLRRRNYHWWLWIGCVLIVLPMLIGCSEASQQISQTTISSTFDPSAIESTINANNSVQMTFGEYTQAAPPLWDDQSKVMTVPIPVLFNNNRIPNLSIEKSLNKNTKKLNMLTIDGFEPGDVIISPARRRCCCFSRKH